MKEENVWDYPRPAICKPFNGTLKITVQGVVLAETNRGYKTLETSHPPTYYFPPEDVQMPYLTPNSQTSMCEWKGKAKYFDFKLDRQCVENIGWCYDNPSASFAQLRHYISFYASKADECFVNGEKVTAQKGDFYGGWITSNLRGPFKGGAGTWGW